ncbi:putative F-box/kelch-repeat protein [Raphanus sativus]|nr:putative F-box/kelch-repeat protein [Raphanus sativus]
MISPLTLGGFLMIDSFPPLGYSVNRNGVSLEGDAYFVAPRDKGNDAFLITKFDFTTETHLFRFRVLILGIKRFFRLLETKKIALLDVCKLEGNMSIWVTNKFDDDDEANYLSWGSDFVMGLNCYNI